MSDNSRPSGFDILKEQVPTYETGWDLLKDPANAAYLARVLPKAPPVSYPPPPLFDKSKMSPKTVGKAFSTTLVPFGKQLVEQGITEFGKKIGYEANGIMQKITYPEPLINEAVNRHLSKF